MHGRHWPYVSRIQKWSAGFTTKFQKTQNEYCRSKSEKKIASTTHQGALLYCKIKAKLSAAALQQGTKSFGQGIGYPATARRIKVNKK